jgi:hypothetical protein
MKTLRFLIPALILVAVFVLGAAVPTFYLGKHAGDGLGLTNLPPTAIQYNDLQGSNVVFGIGAGTNKNPGSINTLIGTGAGSQISTNGNNFLAPDAEPATENVAVGWNAIQHQRLSERGHRRRGVATKLRGLSQRAGAAWGLHGSRERGGRSIQPMVSY